MDLRPLDRALCKLQALYFLLTSFSCLPTCDIFHSWKQYLFALIKKHFGRYPRTFTNSSQSMIGVPESLLDLMCVARTVSLSGCQEQGVCRW